MTTEIHAFDLDKTLITTNCAFKFGEYLYRKKYFSTSTMLQLLAVYGLHKLGLISITKLHYYNFRKLFQGKPAALLYQYAHEFAQSVALYTPANDALRRAQQHSHLTLILSSSPDFIVFPIAQRLGVTQCYATHYEIDKDQRFCKISSVLLGDQKATTLMHYAAVKTIPRKKVTVYSDSHLDLSFLQSAGNPIAVNPNKKLRKICAKQSWPII